MNIRIVDNFVVLNVVIFRNRFVLVAVAQQDDVDVLKTVVEFDFAAIRVRVELEVNIFVLFVVDYTIVAMMMMMMLILQTNDDYKNSIEQSEMINKIKRIILYKMTVTP